MINRADAGGVLFEYGGAPHKILSAIVVWTLVVDVPEACGFSICCIRLPGCGVSGKEKFHYGCVETCTYSARQNTLAVSGYQSVRY